MTKAVGRSVAKGTAILRAQNEKRILAHLRKHQTSTRVRMAEDLHLSKNTVSIIIDKLIADGVVKETGTDTSGVGRPRVEVTLQTRSYQAVGIHIRRDHYQMVVTDYAGDVLESTQNPASTSDARALLGLLSEDLNEVLDRYSRVLGIGVAVPGLVDPDAGIVHSSTHLGWRDVAIREHLRLQSRDIPILALNRVQAAALSPFADATHHAQSMFYVRIDEGVGGALVVGHRLLQGATFTAGEIGHISVDKDGPHCTCGQRGCLESLVRVPRAVAVLRQDSSIHTWDELKTACGPISSACHTEYVTLLATYGTYVGRALASVINLTNPERVIVDSPYSETEEFCRATVGEARRLALSYPGQRTHFEFVDMPQSSAVGMAQAVILHFEGETEC